MRRTLRIVAIVVAALAVVAAVLVLSVGKLAERKRNRVIQTSVAPVPFVSGEAVIQRGKYLYDSRGCMECHGVDGAGKPVINDPGGMYVLSPNISPGPGSVVKDYTEADWVRTGCHGEGFSGGKIPSAPPDWPPAANLTPGSSSVMPIYDTDEKFAAMMRTGKRPDGTAVSQVMPFATLRNMNDTDVSAIYVFLR